MKSHWFTWVLVIKKMCTIFYWFLNLKIAGSKCWDDQHCHVNLPSICARKISRRWVGTEAWKCRYHTNTLIYNGVYILLAILLSFTFHHCICPPPLAPNQMNKVTSQLCFRPRVFNSSTLIVLPKDWFEHFFSAE